MKKKALENEFWNKIYDDYAEIILNTAFNILKDEYLAEDIMQEVMYKYYVYIRENDIQYEKTLLIKVTKNMSMNLLKKTKREVVYEDFEQLKLVESVQENEYPSAEKAYFRELCQNEIDELCDRIFEEVKCEHKNAHEAIKALYAEEEVKKETAKRLQMSESAFYAMLSRLKKKLRKQHGNRYAEITKV